MSAPADSYDFVIIGSGVGGLTAALAAKAAGLTCVVLEKTDKVGGSTALSGGVIWVPNNPVMKREGIEDSLESAREYLEACARSGGPSSTSARREAFLREGSQAIAFLESCGMKFACATGVADYHQGDYPGGHELTRSLVAQVYDLNHLGEWAGSLRRHPPGREVPAMMHELAPIAMCGKTVKSAVAHLRIGGRMLRNRIGARLVGLGAAVQGRMLEIVIRERIPVLSSTPVTDLLHDDERVSGVVAMVGGKSVRIAARRGVLIAAGGFARNARMRSEYHRQPSSVQWTMSNPGDTGEMIEAAIGLGAATANMDMCVWNPFGILPDGSLSFLSGDLRKPHIMLVDSEANRFVNEAGSYVAIGLAAYDRQDRAQAVPAWAIFDQQHRDKYRFGFVMPKKTPEEWYTRGYMLRANTLSELADRCGLDRDKLRTTVARFNGFSRSGVDDDYQRGRGAYERFYGDSRSKRNFCLGTIEKPPFYAVKVYQGDVGTYGGLVTDELSRVMRNDGRVIQGLYATGNSTASVHGRSYPGAGASIAASLVFGYVAACNAAKAQTEIR